MLRQGFAASLTVLGRPSTAAACSEALAGGSKVQLLVGPRCAAACALYQPTAAAARPYAASALESLQEAASKIRKAAASSAEAVKAAGSSISHAPDAVYNALPKPAQQLVNAAQMPGAVNRVLSLQLTAFWQNHGNAAIALGAAGACYGLWRALLGASSVFVDVGGSATGGMLAIAASGVAFGYLYLRRRYTIDPQAVYRLAMYRLNTHPGLLEVMGAPLVGSHVQASVLTGGSLHFKGLRPRLQSKRLQMIFPLKGAERRGLVSLEAKKRHGHLRFVLLAVDVPSVAGGEQRIYLEGGPALYERGGVLGVLREPFIRALSMDEAFLQEDEAEDAAEARERNAAAAERSRQAAAKRPQPLDQGGGMYFYERAMLWAKQQAARVQQHPEQQKPLAAPAAAAAEAPAAAAAGGKA
ncbi:hypothetical protein COHA_002285 [Chlorella ohadii]|uniref:Uncharacterized protein n=1 Tax=Chlorella ohadii TaxID=2649997 RepID=A0AAD5DUA3_9CHLO|nr:hypothetical protein COHA_002285 [Chlorella ohadii]